MQIGKLNDRGRGFKDSSKQTAGNRVLGVERKISLNNHYLVLRIEMEHWAKINEKKKVLQIANFKVKNENRMAQSGKRMALQTRRRKA